MFAPNVDKAKFVETAERGLVRSAEAVLGSSVGHVEVFQMRRVGIFILGRPRPLPGERRADRSIPSIVKSRIGARSPGRLLRAGGRR
ncbi:hypothetical protein EU513_02815 [Yimella sp. RIT 621]|nr:hypothetical protein EU513_02815 [Yimella sp. RIT 621]